MTINYLSRAAGRVSAITVLLALLSALSSPETCSGADLLSPSDAALFDSRRLLEVRIEMAPQDWDALRLEHHDLLAAIGPNRLEKPEPNPYNTYQADVTMDGSLVRSVGVRKRGFIGSASSQRPSLGIRFDASDPDRVFRGLKRMALNNNLQDPSQLHQVLAYRVFAKAGVAAPRCSLARVTVNGKLLGIYSHVEAIEPPFLKNHFGSSDGNLYEGQLSDFRPGWVKTLEKKNHKDSPDRSDLEAVVRALESDDAHLLARLEPQVDLDAYLTYWAVEALIGHWDSYSNNGNNFLVYRPAATGKFVFIPWGADSVFGDKDPFTPFKTPESVKARSLLPRRLYQLAATRQRYRERLRHLLQTVWNERELLAEVDRLQALVKDDLQVSPFHFRTGVSKLRTFIRTRRAELEKELDGPAPEWDVPLKKGPCLEKAGSVTALFSTTWQKSRPLNPLTNGTATLALDLNGRSPTFAATSAIVVPGDEPRNDGHPTLSLIGLQQASLRLQILILVIQPELYKPRTSLKVDGFSVGGVLLEGALWGEEFRISGFPVGTLKLQDAGSHPGEAVSGRLQADLYQMPQ
jgi:spore coat protein CotH